MPCTSSDLTEAMEQTSSGRRPEIGQQTEQDCQLSFRHTLKAQVRKSKLSGRLV
jgi:hypothetical protein